MIRRVSIRLFCWLSCAAARWADRLSPDRGRFRHVDADHALVVTVSVRDYRLPDSYSKAEIERMLHTVREWERRLCWRVPEPAGLTRST